MKNDLQTQAINRSKGYQNSIKRLKILNLKIFMFKNFYDNENVNLKTIKHWSCFLRQFLCFFFYYFLCLLILYKLNYYLCSHFLNKNFNYYKKKKQLNIKKSITTK